MSTIYALQSGYTSDPYEPSETLTFGVFSSKAKAQKAFVAYVLSCAVKIEPALKAPTKYPSAERDEVLAMLMPLAPAMVGVIAEWARSKDPIAEYSAMKSALPKTYEKIRDKISEASSVAFDAKAAWNDPRRRRWDAFCELTRLIEDDAIGLHADSFAIVPFVLDKLAESPVQCEREQDDE